MTAKSFKLCHDYSSSFTMSNVGESLWSLIRGDRTQVYMGTGNFIALSLRPP